MPLLKHIVRTRLKALQQGLRRIRCTLTACKQVPRGYNLMGRHDDRIYGVWECRRCGRIRLGRPT